MAGGLAIADATHEGMIALTPKTAVWADTPAVVGLPPGSKIQIIHGDPFKSELFTLRLKFPKGYVIPAHNHPTDEHVTLITGSFGLGGGDKFDKKAGKVVPAGSFAKLPKGMNHFAWADKESVVQIHAIGPFGLTYVDAANDPRKAAKK